MRAAVPGELLQKGRSRLFVDEPVRIEWTNVGDWRLFGPSEDQAQPRIGRERGRAVELNEADVQAFVQTIKEAGECAARQPRGRTTT